MAGVVARNTRRHSKRTALWDGRSRTTMCMTGTIRREMGKTTRGRENSTFSAPKARRRQRWRTTRVPVKTTKCYVWTTILKHKFKPNCICNLLFIVRRGNWDAYSVTRIIDGIMINCICLSMRSLTIKDAWGVLMVLLISRRHIKFERFL